MLAWRAQKCVQHSSLITSFAEIVGIRREACFSFGGQRRRLFNYSSEFRAGLPAFVFDIDGVLIRGKQVLPAAKQALAKLYSPGGQSPKYPVAFLTNGGGMSEEAKAEQLSDWLGVQVQGSQVVLSHTPFKQLVPALQDKPVLVSGMGHVVHVARHYGFRRTITTKQIARMLPTSVPSALDSAELRQPGEGSAMAARYLSGEQRIGTEADPIAAILVFHDPSDWYKELQVMMDVLTSKGVPGRKNPPADAADVQVFFSNPDLLWANEFPAPRFGQGSFAVCLEALHVKIAGRPLHAKKAYGKPNPEPYTLIEELLVQQAHELGLVDGGAPPASAAANQGSAPHSSPGAGGGSSRTAEEGTDLPFSNIYAVGDNPAADVRGANRAGHPWVSVLVKTGVFDGTLYANCPNDPAHMVVDDVAAAVEAALHRHRATQWHSMR